jgi:YHS domain-containing protein
MRYGENVFSLTFFQDFTHFSRRTNMKTLYRWVTGTLLLALVASPGVAKTKKAAKATSPVCPVCKMTLHTQKSKEFSVPEKINGKTYYCCNKCDMSSMKKKTSKAEVAPTCPVCKMALHAKKSKEFSVAEKINGKTWYCCNKCDMSSMKKKSGASKDKMK